MGVGRTLAVGGGTVVEGGGRGYVVIMGSVPVLQARAQAEGVAALAAGQVVTAVVVVIPVEQAGGVEAGVVREAPV